MTCTEKCLHIFMSRSGSCPHKGQHGDNILKNVNSVNIVNFSNLSWKREMENLASCSVLQVNNGSTAHNNKNNINNIRFFHAKEHIPLVLRHLFRGKVESGLIWATWWEPAPRLSSLNTNMRNLLHLTIFKRTINFLIHHNSIHSFSLNLFLFSFFNKNNGLPLTN